MVCQELNNIVAYFNEHEMKIYTRKTKVMLFNQSRTVDIQPEIIVDDVEIEMTEEMKLLGVVITSNLKWRRNTEYITQRGYARLWMLKRLKKLGCPVEQLVDTYVKQVRCILEMACPVWHPALTQADSKAIERVQKSALYIILGELYSSYDSALEALAMTPLDERRETLCLNFALKSESHPIHSQWFKERGDGPETRHHNKFQPVWTDTKRYRKFPIPYLTQLLNNHYKE